MALLDLTGRVALVTGGGRRVGASIGRAMAAAGCDLVVHYAAGRDGAELVAEEARSLGRMAWTAQADLREGEQIEQLARQTLERTGGRLDVLVNNAAGFERVQPEALAEEHWERALELNAKAPYLLTLALSSALRNARGTMIAIACVSATRPWKNYIPYSVSKAAIVQLVRGLALGLAPEVRVNAVAPGAVLLPEGYDEKQGERLRARVPLGRFGEADDIARAVLFLAQNDYITGHVLTVDAGLSLR